MLHETSWPCPRCLPRRCRQGSGSEVQRGRSRGPHVLGMPCGARRPQGSHGALQQRSAAKQSPGPALRSQPEACPCAARFPMHPGPAHPRAGDASSAETLQGVGSHPFSSRALLFYPQSPTLGWPRVRWTSLSLQVCKQAGGSEERLRGGPAWPHLPSRKGG